MRKLFETLKFTTGLLSVVFVGLGAFSMLLTATISYVAVVLIMLGVVLAYTTIKLERYYDARYYPDGQWSP